MDIVDFFVIGRMGMAGNDNAAVGFSRQFTKTGGWSVAEKVFVVICRAAVKEADPVTLKVKYDFVVHPGQVFFVLRREMFRRPGIHYSFLRISRFFEGFAVQQLEYLEVGVAEN
mmetsp:Transcript_24709/g.11824  ORF Transcript_24709/g.11824 Transcript_24709/m.11824 type:complete len:114 (-) Transcript_24709:29-370(-)